MNNRFLLLLIMILCFIPESVVIAEDNIGIDNIIEEQLEKLNIEELQRTIDNITKDNEQYLKKIDVLEYIKSLLKGERVFSFEEVLKSLLTLIFKEIMINSKLLGQLLILSILCAVLTNIQSAFEKNTVGELAFYVCYMLLIAIAMKSFVISMSLANKAIDEMVLFMQALLPILITLLLAVGGITSAAIFKPIIFGSVSIMSTLMKNVILPLIFFSAIIGIISKLSNKVQISKLSSIIRQITTTLLGMLLTIFLGIMSIHGVTTSKLDGVTIKTAKFAMDSFIPIVGGFLSEAIDTVVSCSLLLKNAVGVIGLVLIFIICVIPIIKIVSLILIYKFTTVIIEPISDERIIQCLNEISKSLLMIFAVISSVGIMFFIAVTIIVGAGNITTMLR
ncbi:stage III sporulation protein AE [Caloranaerobacter azorensis DSM 13643]|uniref:Stage III sporulation protein AE n=1 Tax=Caloranaerobacter azorensis DSM 13643 TaxID=1121264 RepID=A0A1M5RX36_9FIRM|nr:stage III sporulation protein AE [Caloranaerobacter azorensis]SHH30917.1 stage III sporulation protein AE [Caloranaerobacter azorensis DSM 13643]